MSSSRKTAGSSLATKETGTDRGQRDDARRVYAETIRKISNSQSLGGRNLNAIWDEIRNCWQFLSQKALAQRAAAAD